MANLSETATYDAGVYQLETTDPVQGGASGVSNSPLKNLANRTAYLKSHVDSLEAGTTIPPTVAPLASPTFTGDPKGPTAAAGDNDTSLATTAFVQLAVGGRLSKSVAGGANVTLTAAEAGNAILDLSGTLTANIAVIVPTSPTRAWIVKNGTGGAFTVTMKTAAGTGVVVVQGKNQLVWTDGTNVYDAITEFDSVAMTGDPTAPTAAQFDNDTSIATTAFVQRALGNVAGQSNYSTTSTIPASDAGKRILASGAGITLTLPLLSSVAVGSVLWIKSSGGDITVQRQGTDTILAGITSPTSVSVKYGEVVKFVAGPSNWNLEGGDVLNKVSPQFGSSISSNGYQKLPSGLIVQWGNVTVGAGGEAITYPIAFPNGRFQITGTPGGSSNSASAGHPVFSPGTLTGCNVYYWGTSNFTAQWIAVGY